MKTLLSLIFFILFVIIGIYLVNNGERITTINEKDIIGEYIFIHNKNEAKYKVILYKDHSLSCKIIKNNKVSEISNGTWKLNSKYPTPFIESTLNKDVKFDFFMGKLKKNFFLQTIKIEAISMGDFHGEEDNSYFIKIK